MRRQPSDLSWTRVKCGEILDASRRRELPARWPWQVWRRGHHAHSSLTRYVSIPGASLAPIVDALGPAFEVAARRGDVELVDLERLYGGAC